MGLTESIPGVFPDRKALTPKGHNIIVQLFWQQPEAVEIKIYLGYYPFYAMKRLLSDI